MVRTALYVDGMLADENTAEPFDQFTWDLSGYTTSGQHILTVEAVDTLGLSKVSLGVPVLVTVVRPQFGLLPWLSRNSLWVALGAILFAGGVLGAILIRELGKKTSFGNGRPRLPPRPADPIRPGRGKKRGLRPAVEVVQPNHLKPTLSA